MAEYQNQVIVFDETPSFEYLPVIIKGVELANAIPTGVDDVDIALNGLKHCNAVIATANPDTARDDFYPEVAAKPLIEEAHKLKLPVAILAQHPAAKKLVIPELNDTLIQTGSLLNNTGDIRVGSKLENIPSKIKDWLSFLALDVKLDIEGLNLSQPPENVLPDFDDISKGLFNSYSLLKVGTYLANRKIEAGDFHVLQLSKELNISASNLYSNLRKLIDLKMVKVDRPDGNVQMFYRKNQSPLWRVFEVMADILIDKPVK